MQSLQNKEKNQNLTKIESNQNWTNPIWRQTTQCSYHYSLFLITKYRLKLIFYRFIQRDRSNFEYNSTQKGKKIKTKLKNVIGFV